MHDHPELWPDKYNTGAAILPPSERKPPYKHKKKLTSSRLRWLLQRAGAPTSHVVRQKGTWKIRYAFRKVHGNKHDYVPEWWTKEVLQALTLLEIEYKFISEGTYVPYHVPDNGWRTQKYLEVEVVIPPGEW
jgi:hypothetical protein